MSPRDSEADPIDDLWRAFARSADPDIWKRLVLHYSPLVKLVVGRLTAGLPSAVDPDDMLSDGLIGLMDAIRKFDFERGLKFQTYAISRIRGSIVDAQRASDWVPRQVRTRIRSVSATQARLEQQWGRSPTDQEVAAALEITAKELFAIYSEASYTQVMSLDAAEWADGVSGTGADSDALPLDFHPAVRRLPQRDQIVLSLYYWERLSLTEIAQVLGVSESRISQVHGSAIRMLRSSLSVAAG
jgi:RNA polymerase sigma factor for flagellar operon FliA